MKFEYDENKSLSNYKKHGIDFEEAKALWEDDRLLEIQVWSEPEKRFICIGKIGKKHWSAIITYRSNHIRIISVRRSRKEEENLYDQ